MCTWPLGEGLQGEMQVSAQFFSLNISLLLQVPHAKEDILGAFVETFDIMIKTVPGVTRKVQSCAVILMAAASAKETGSGQDKRKF